MTSYTRCSNVVCIHVNRKVLKRVAVNNARVGMRFGQLNHSLVILCVLVHYVLADFGNVKDAVQ